MPSTHHLAILSIIISASALGIALVGFSRSSQPTVSQSAAVVAPLLDLQQAAAFSSTQSSPDQVRDEWMRLNALYPHTYTHEATGLTFDYPYEFELRAEKISGADRIFVEHPPTGMAIQFFIQPTDIPVDALVMQRLLEQAGSIPGRIIEGYNPETTLGDYSQIPVLKMGLSEQGIGQYREAWFVHNGHLFQMTMVNANPDVLDGWFNAMVHQNIYFPDSNMIVLGRTDIEGNPLPERNFPPGKLLAPEDIL
jgi:hypothetical protein